MSRLEKTGLMRSGLIEDCQQIRFTRKEPLGTPTLYLALESAGALWFRSLAWLLRLYTIFGPRDPGAFRSQQHIV